MAANDSEPRSSEENFELRSLIGQGGVGRVFLAFDKSIGREVAVKELLPAKLVREREHHVARFIREAKISGQLAHPGIVPVYELTKKPDGTFFYVMKYVQGKTLLQAIAGCVQEDPLEAFRERIKLLDNLIDVADAMAYAHSKGIIHRDLKPSNIVLGEFGETVILDWGFAKRVGEDELADATRPLSSMTDEEEEDLTREGAKIGTPSYMSPEQIDPAYGNVDASTDVYTLGVILFLILTGKRPYPGKGEMVMKIITDPEMSPSPSSLYDFIPPELSAICEKAMAKNKKDRFKDASELAAELKAYRDGRLVSVYAYSKGELFKRFISRNKTAISASIAVMLAIIVGAGFALNFAAEAQRARRASEQAIVDVTSLAESTMVLARQTVGRMDGFFHEALNHMYSTAKDLAPLNLSSSKVVRSKLESFSQKFPNALSLVVSTADGKLAEALVGKKAQPEKMSSSDFNALLEEITAGKHVLSDVIHAYKGQHAIVMRVPIRQGSRVKGSLIAVFSINKAIESAITFDPSKSDYQVWCMKKDGYIFYDENPREIGSNLFTDELYKNYPELIEFGERISKEPWGVGHYRYIAKGDDAIVYKIAAWDSFEPTAETEWKIIIAHQYILGRRQ